MSSWFDVAVLGDLDERKPAQVAAGREPVLLLRVREEIFAIGNQCTHQGAQLDKGVVRVSGSVQTVTCPAHGSMFDFETGKVMRPPATKPVPAYDVKVEDGRVFVRPRVES
jgi:3-phenylpropionate/trans-cinnamate dioxygenase ferredoxin subunit